MRLLADLGLGFAAAFTWVNLFYCFLGSLLGTLIGVLPGIGPTMTIALLLPVTFSLPPLTALIMLAGIFYGAQYGGSTTSILINLPGETSSVVTALDGYQLARKGRAGAALATAAISSFAAGTIATLIIALLAPPLATVALKFQAPEYFSLMVLGLLVSVSLSSGSVVKAMATTLVGVLVGIVGTDVTSGVERFTLGLPDLYDGINFVPIAIGMFGIAEIVRNLGNDGEGSRTVRSGKLSGLSLSLADLKRIVAPTLRGTGIGSLLGILPGGGVVLASFSSYAVEKRVSRNAAEFGEGALEGVAAPEAANNAASQTSFIPMLTLGIPSNAVMAMMMGALLIHGIAPGPRIMTQQPTLFWGLVASMWVGNLMLVVLNLPLVGIWAKVAEVPYRILYPAIVAISCVGSYAIGLKTTDVLMLAAFGVAGYVLTELKCELAPMLFGIVVGPMMEENMRRALILSRGDPSIFVRRPISAGLLFVAAAAIILAAAPKMRKRREDVFGE
jgi:putative tricarboxylic transport membrane protein